MKEIHCPKCGATKEFLRNIGTESNMMRCENCGDVFMVEKDEDKGRGDTMGYMSIKNTVYNSDPLYQPTEEEHKILKDIAKYICDNYKDTILHENIKDPDNITDPADWLLDQIDQYFTYDLIGLCGCGYPESVKQKIVDYLWIVDEWRKDVNERRGYPPLEPINRRKNNTKEKFNVYDTIDDPMLLFMAYILDDKGLTDHGSGISGCWITDRGRMCLYVYQLVLKASN